MLAASHALAASRSDPSGEHEPVRGGLAWCGQQEAVAEEDCAKHATTLGYYHFDSSGRKFKNKWDDFDVDAECQRVDQEEALEAVLKRALGLGAKLERCG